ncbi:glycosyl hydrolases family 18-domain-containing protein [Coniella lustricola]|uniref:chitinase n=1 Tax=Coniella lustricola TaxID=2025994 RepID=A0A2T3A0D9_9PEZI|nr:glycosyl hydrolases family 18-domain-containing protein [Coniella lustricola]
MEPYVDFFGLMTYDLHGPWDASVVDIGKVIIGQTNVPEIYNWTLPLWYDSVDPSKINMGLAYYGRGYTVANVDCTEVGCAWSGVSNPAPCTAFGGVMSLEEIEDIIIPELGIEPILDSDAMMKYLVWSDQWMGYDDLETIAMKKNWASEHCFGGTMIWSIDLYSGSGSGNTPDGGGSSSSTDPGAGGGNDGSSESESGGIVYIDPTIWAQPSPTIQCDPPCTFILPPYSLAQPTTITFPLYTTSLDVAWSESTGWTSIVETTTLTIPPVTTSLIEVWEFTWTDTNTATTVFQTFSPTSSVRPPPFTITDNPNPLSQSGVTHSPVTRTITPPPYPYSVEAHTSTTSSTTTSGAAILFPIVTVKPGTPGPICKSGCGIPCLIFCDSPCLLDCTDPGDDYDDPSNPDPPPRPTPTDPEDPAPTSGMTKVTPTPEPSDPQETDPGDEEEEDEDDQCALDNNLPQPTYVDPNAGSTGNQTISTPGPTPTPAPKPNPTPPSPDPATESLHCYNSGAMTGRGSMIDAVTAFCNQYDGTVLDASDTNAQHTLTYSDHNAGVCFGELGCTEVLQLSVTVTNGCRFTVDGPDTDQDCGRIFREAIDQCDTSSTKYKQGGTITSNCALWVIDPNNYW